MSLSKCVFCHGKARMNIRKYDGEMKFNIHCIKCGFKLNGFDTKKEAKDEWNGMKSTADSREFFIQKKVPFGGII